jgi:hypothetical protein
VNTFSNYLNTGAMDLKTKNRIKILAAIANGKKGKRVTKYTKAINPREVMTKKDFERNAFKYKDQ